MGAATISLVGRISTVEAVESKSDSKFVVINVATNEGSGEDRKTCFYQVRLFPKGEEQLKKALSIYTVGRLVSVTGSHGDGKSLGSIPFTRKDGSLGVNNPIRAFNWPELLDSNPSKETKDKPSFFTPTVKEVVKVSDPAFTDARLDIFEEIRF